MIKRVTREETNKIIDTREPLGEFLEIGDNTFIAIDNSTGDAWVEEFENIEECICWLNREEYYKNLDERKICKQALDVYGKEAQICMVFEEMAELQKELCKYLRGKGHEVLIAEEIADLEIMFEQMRLLFGIEEDVKAFKNRKLDRLAERLK